MIPVVGSVSLNLAFGFSILTLITIAAYIRWSDYRLYLTGQRLAIGVSILSIIATLVLVNELLVSNFDVDYVARYSSLETPTIYKFAALWAGQAGSLLFWLCVLSVYTLIVVLQYRRKYHRLMPWIIMILASVQLFFLVLTNFITNPFDPTQADFIIKNGNGLNPLLQNLTMAIHPPTLYLGYIGFTIPFAFGIAALITNDTSQIWIRSVRRWTLITWLFLTIGIVLGGWWAYQELGWGGYWAWDPVENASFMPWLTATAFVHSIIIQEKKNMLRVWNMILIILTFTLAIFGTFLTRSGIMSSVHSFAKSSLGPAFLIYILFILAVSIFLLLWRLPSLKTARRLESFTSRESGFLFNNVIFITICFAVFWGTLFPVVSEAVRGTKITVGPPFFNQINIPIGLFLLCLTGVGPLLAWRKTTRQGFVKNFSIPILVSLIALVVLLVVKFSGYVLVTFTLALFVVTAIGMEFYRGVRARKRSFHESIGLALLTMIRKNRSRYGGYIAHLGIVFMFIGFAGHAFDQEIETAIKQGEEFHLAGYRFKLDRVMVETANTPTDQTQLTGEHFKMNRVTRAERSNHHAWIGDLTVIDNRGQTVTILRPEKRFYLDHQEWHSELDIYSTINKDIYSVFSGIDIEQGIASLKVMINPLVWWVWFGGYVLVFGTLISLWPARSKQ